MKTRSARPVARIAAPLRALIQRFSFMLLVLLSIALMMVGKVDAVLVDGVRARVIDGFAPIMEAIARPAATAARFVESAVALKNAHEESERLRRENAILMQWKQAALRLEAENNSLRSLLHYHPDPALSFITGRVISAPGGSFMRTLVVLAGKREGVRTGQAAMAGTGMIGRVVEVGEWSSRILLVTDINARIPVMLESSRQKAMLAGDNSDQPRLMYLPPEAPVSVGDRVVTSGHGGLFPAGLPIGVVSAVGERAIKVQPLVDLNRVEHVQLVDFGLPGSLNPEPERTASTSPGPA
ncbi:MAG TPA: rod shape-determining protein MreC, partial [Azospirillaceae bacterium]|nr:rod shape-determining protein MreC [Azospirillaceae bacterium]